MVTTMMGEGDISADVCVVDTKADLASLAATPSVLGAAPAVRRGGGILASQAADNLFWFGRYMERAETTVRVIRAVLGSSIEVDAAAGHNPEVIARLVDLMVSWGALSREEAARPIAQACHAALSDTAMNGSVGALFAAIRATALTLRDRFTTDFWRIASRPLPAMDGHRPGAAARRARIDRAAFGPFRAARGKLHARPFAPFPRHGPPPGTRGGAVPDAARAGRADRYARSAGRAARSF
jgi:hypothetical protein